MKQLLLSYKAQALTLIFVWLVSMLFSAEFLLSLCMILLAALAVFHLEVDRQHIRFGIRKTFISNWKRLYAQKAFLVVMLPFLVVLVSALWSSDTDYMLERLRIKLPFLVLPYIFLSIPHIRRKELFLVYYFLLALMTVACIYVGINYLLQFEQINELITKGQTIPTPSNHVRFSLVLCFAIFGGLVLFGKNFFIQYPWERYLIGGASLFLFAFIHVLSVRSGLAVLYLSILILGFRYVLQTRRFVLGAVAMIILAGLPLLAYQTIPSFRSKVSYTYWDIGQYFKGAGASSDSDRLTSIEVGMQIGNAHPLLGVGAGDLKRAVHKVYAERFGEGRKPHMPHNQFVSIYAGTGIPGLILFLFAFFFPLFYRRNYRDPLFLVLHVVIFFSFFMENTVENNFGVSFYLLFLLLGLNHLNLGKEARKKSH